MTLSHDDFSLTRTIAAAPATVWRAWADPVTKRQWFVENDGPGWALDDYSLDFTVGGRERGVWIAEAPDQPWNGEHVNETVYLDIAEPERIVYAYTMALNGQIHSASLATVQFAPTEAGTRLTFTEQIALYTPGYGVDGRIDGWNKLLNSLETILH